jgi:hypothetical protein
MLDGPSSEAEGSVPNTLRFPGQPFARARNGKMGMGTLRGADRAGQQI